MKRTARGSAANYSEYCWRIDEAWPRMQRCEVWIIRRKPELLEPPSDLCVAFQGRSLTLAGVAV